MTSPLAFVASAMTLWEESDFRRTPVFPGRCLELNSEALVLDMYTEAWAELGGKGVLPEDGPHAKPPGLV
jgi:hypothetical protein